MGAKKTSSGHMKHPYLKEGFVFNTQKPTGKILPPKKQEEFRRLAQDTLNRL